MLRRYLAVINHPGRRPRGVRRCFWEPSSNRLAEQCETQAIWQRSLARSIGRDSLTLSLTRARSVHTAKNNLHLIRSHIPPQPVCQSLTVAMDLQSVQAGDTVSYSVNTKGSKWFVLLFCLERGSTVRGMPCQIPSHVKISENQYTLSLWLLIKVYNWVIN